jgi:cell division protein DivIC
MRAALLSSLTNFLFFLCMRHLPFIFSQLRNKYLLATLAFVVWMLFFDKNDLFAQLERKNELNALQESKEYFTKEIQKERKFSEELQSNPAAIEKFAREQYKMKRDGEDLYIIQPAQGSSK